MAGLENKQEEEALERVEEQKRPRDLPNGDTLPPESLRDEVAWKRPTRVEHTSEKEHPPGKE